MVIKKALTLVVLQSLMFSAVSFASDNIDENNKKDIKNDKAVIQVDKCPSIVKMTNKLVKYIGEDKNGQLFLDSEGYKVSPCKGKNDFVYFFKIDKYPDGKKLFEESKSQVLNETYYDQGISVNIDDDYKISYGTKNYEVSDIQDFQKNLQAEILELKDYDKLKEDVKVPSNEKENMKTFFQIEKSYYQNIPEEYSNDIEEEKQVIIQERYKMLVDELNAQINALTTEDRTMAHELAVTNNRLLNPSDKVISLYNIDSNIATKEDRSYSNGMTPYGEIQGNLYLLYNSSGAKSKYLSATKEFLLEEISNPKLSLDEKFALMVNLTQGQEGDNTGIFIKQAEAYKNSLTNEWANNLKKLQTMNPEGLRLYNFASDKEKVEFNQFVNSINMEIIDKEYNSLPQQINKKQYKALSNLDKYKYAPKKEGDFINKNLYEKTDIERILKYQVKK